MEYMVELKKNHDFSVPFIVVYQMLSLHRAKDDYVELDKEGELASTSLIYTKHRNLHLLTLLQLSQCVRVHYSD